MNYLDLFSGIGGFRLGLKNAGHEFLWEGFSETDKYAKFVYQRHFPKATDLGDVRTIRPDTLPKIDLLTFGFPCQDLSVAGKRKGLHAERSGLFFEAMRIIRATHPKVFIFENVLGLLSSNSGRDFTTVLRAVADIGLYECEWQVVNTRWFLPQNRKRIFFIGYAGKESRPKVFPIKENAVLPDSSLQETRSEGQRICSPSINAGYGKVRGGGELFIQDNRLSGGQRKIRRLTPLECERLQGFPDGFTGGLSDTRRYMVLGNAVTVAVVKAIAERLIEDKLPLLVGEGRGLDD